MRSPTQRQRHDSSATIPTNQEIASILASGIVRQIIPQLTSDLPATIQPTSSQPADSRPALATNEPSSPHIDNAWPVRD